MRKYIVLTLLVAALTFVFAGTASANYPHHGGIHYGGGARFNFGSGVGLNFYNGRVGVSVGNGYYPYRNQYYAPYYRNYYRPPVRQFYVPPVSIYRPGPVYAPTYPTYPTYPPYSSAQNGRIEQELQYQQQLLNQQGQELRQQKAELDALKRDQQRVEQKVDWHEQLLKEIMKGP